MIKSILYHKMVPINKEKTNAITLTIPIGLGYADTRVVNIITKITTLTSAYDFTYLNETINWEFIGFNR